MSSSATTNIWSFRRKWDEAFSDEDDEETLPTSKEKDDEDYNEGDGMMEMDDNTYNQDDWACPIISCHFIAGTKEFLRSHLENKHNHKCSVCKAQLPTAHILELHVLEKHDNLFELFAKKQPMYSCYIKACPEVFMKPSDRRTHSVKIHGFSKHFSVGNVRVGKILKGIERRKNPQLSNDKDPSEPRDVTMSNVLHPKSEPSSSSKLKNSGNQSSRAHSNPNDAQTLDDKKKEMNKGLSSEKSTKSTNPVQFGRRAARSFR